MKWTVVFACLLISTASAEADEFFALGGTMATVGSDKADSSYSWQLEYRQDFTEHVAASLSYLNEGHVPNHHRDGNALQLWAQTDLLEKRLSVSAGIGPYHYFDTTTPSTNDGSYTNEHGFGVSASLAAIWKTENRWLFQLRTNWVKAFGSIDTVSALAGIGYQLDAPASTATRAPSEPAGKKTTENEITLFAGRTITNSFASERSTSLSIEYRRGLLRYLDWTVAWLYEGDTRLIRRGGLVSQFWAVKAFLNDSITLGAGSGAYFAIDERAGKNQDDDGKISAIATLTGSYRFHPHWSLRASWNRIITNYNRDTDVIMGGIGYRF